MILKKFVILTLIGLSGLVTLAKSEILSDEISVNLNQAKETKAKEILNLETDTESLKEPNENEDASGPVLKVMELNLNDEDKVMLQNLNGIIEKVPDMKEVEATNREGKSFKDENLKRAAEALTDEEITEIIKSIAFPNNDDITEDNESIKPASESEIEPRMGRALKNHHHGYYVIAFTPIEEDESVSKLHDSVPYTRLQILPAERSVSGGGGADARFMSKKAWNKYIRRIMRQIRKGTRKIQRKTKVKTLKEEPTVESFLKRMYKITQEQRLKQQTKKKTSWFLW